MIKYKKGYKYQLYEDYSVQTPIAGYDIEVRYIKLESNGMLTIYKSYAWDGASGGAPDLDSFMRPSLVHDVFYQLIRRGLVDKSDIHKINLFMKTLCIEDKMFKFLAIIFYRLVDKFANRFTSESRLKPVLTAPKSR